MAVEKSLVWGLVTVAVPAILWVWFRFRLRVPPGPCAVVYGNGEFIAVGPKGLLLASPDGRSWTKRPLGSPRDDVWQITYGNGVYLAVGFQWGYTSTDGQHWTRHRLPVGMMIWVAFAGRFFYLGGQHEDGNHSELYVSQDGVEWSLCLGGIAGELTAGTSGNGTILLLQIRDDTDQVIPLTSTDGRTWTAQPVISRHWPAHIQFEGGRFFLRTDGGEIFVSTTGTDWQLARTDPPLSRPAWVAHGSERYVLASGDGHIFSSLNGSDWRLEYTNADHAFEGVAYGNGAFVAIGSKAVAHSTDGHTWSLIPLDTLIA